MESKPPLLIRRQTFSVLTLLAAIGFGNLPAHSEEVKREPALKDLAGEWEVVSANANAGLEFVFPKETGLNQKGARVAVRGNELTLGGKTVATLTTGFSGTGIDFDKQVWFKRRPVMFTMPDGTGILCAYSITDGWMELVHPHTTGRVGAGSWIRLHRSEK